MGVSVVRGRSVEKQQLEDYWVEVGDSPAQRAMALVVGLEKAVGCLGLVMVAVCSEKVAGCLGTEMVALVAEEHIHPPGNQRSSSHYTDILEGWGLSCWQHTHTEVLGPSDFPQSAASLADTDTSEPRGQTTCLE